MSEVYTQADFVSMALAEFPRLGPDFEEDEGLLHLQMHSFTRLAQTARQQGDWATYRRCIRLADRLWARPDPHLLNALNVSFLEHLDFSGPRGPVAWAHLSSTLQDGWHAMRAYNEQLLERAKPKAKQEPRRGRRKRK